MKSQDKNIAGKKPEASVVVRGAAGRGALPSGKPGKLATPAGGKKAETPKDEASLLGSKASWVRRGLLVTVAFSALLLEPSRPVAPELQGGAQAAGDAKPAEAPKSGEKSSGQKVETKEVITPNTPLSDEQLKVLKTLEKRRDALDQRELELNRREDRVKTAEKNLDAKYSELKSIRDEIKGLFDAEKKARDERVKAMVTTICLNMKPDQAAQVLQNMDTPTVLRIMSLTPEKQLGKILEKMDKAKAAKLTTEYMNYQLKMPKPPQ